jgi:KDO2-lipid IV(A) lauroyltransferase
MILLLKALTRIPLPVLHGIARAVAFVAFHVLHWRREFVERDVANAFPERSPGERAVIVRESYYRAADTMVEAFWGFGASAGAFRKRVTIENPHVVQRCIDEGRSVVLLTAHYANWEWLLLAAGVHFGIPLDVVYQPQRVGKVDTFLREARSRFGSSLIPRKEFVYELMARAGQARGYAVIADQTPKHPDPKVWTTFLNQETPFFPGAGMIAKYLEADVVYVGMRRIARGRYTVRFTVLAEPPYDEVEEDAFTRRYAAALEAQVRESPADFLWLQKKWKYTRAADEAEARARGDTARSGRRGGGEAGGAA